MRRLKKILQCASYGTRDVELSRVAPTVPGNAKLVARQTQAIIRSAYFEPAFLLGRVGN